MFQAANTCASFVVFAVVRFTRCKWLQTLLCLILAPSTWMTSSRGHLERYVRMTFNSLTLLTNWLMHSWLPMKFHLGMSNNVCHRFYRLWIACQSALWHVYNCTYVSDSFTHNMLVQVNALWQCQSNWNIIFRRVMNRLFDTKGTFHFASRSFIKQSTRGQKVVFMYMYKVKIALEFHVVTTPTHKALV